MSEHKIFFFYKSYVYPSTTPTLSPAMTLILLRGC